MTQVEIQAIRDAKDAAKGARVSCPYCHRTQERQYNEWTMAFNAKLIKLECSNAS